MTNARNLRLDRDPADAGAARPAARPAGAEQTSTAPRLRILYFAWLRTMTGRAADEVSPPQEVATVGQLMDWLAARDPGFAEAMRARGVIRAAVNQDYAGPDHPVRPGDEVAFFPPVTGG